MKIITVPIKVNLMLHLLGKLPNNYHAIQSLIVFPQEGGDQLELTPHSTWAYEISGPFSAELSTKDNLIVKAVSFLHALYPNCIPYHIKLIKNIPLSSGIGGGSSDAATLIAALLEECNLTLSFKEKKELIKKSSCLGADTPVCLSYHLLKERFFWVEGIGEQVKPLFYPSFKNFFMVLVNPLKSVSTPLIFSKVAPPYDKLIPPLDSLDLLTFLQNTRNSLTPITESMIKEVRDILGFFNTKKSCKLSRMSGSGATCFGIFSEKEEAEKAFSFFQQSYPSWWSYLVKS